MGVRKARFRAAGDLLAVLGAEMIGNKVLGLVELIKNAWDADATAVHLKLADTNQPSQTVLTLRDNGYGMTLEDVVERWLVPATKGKKEQKAEGRRSPMGRLPLGEKGIGRFACQKLARHLEMVTRATGSPGEVVVRLDWDKFEGETALEDIEFEVEDRLPEVFTGSASGTQLTMRGARDRWTEHDVSTLQRDIRRLQRPSVDAMTISEFSVTLSCEEFPEHEDVTPPDLHSRSHYTFTAYVDADGSCDWEYVCQHPDVPARTSTGRSDLSKTSAESAACGPFFLGLSTWDRSAAAMRAVGLSGKDLDAYCGVSVYRDGMRVYPYGQPGDDWLHLDRERPNNPSKLLGNNQVVGLVQFDQADNPQLTDKANRDGFQDNDQFRAFHGLVRAALLVFTAEWNRDKPERAQPHQPADAVAALPDAKRIAEALKSSADSTKTVNVPASALPTVAQREADGDPKNSVAVSEPAALEQLLGKLRDVEQELELTRQERAVLLEVTAVGMAAQRASHEFLRQLAAARSAAKALRQSVRGANQITLAQTLDTTLQVLANEIRIVAPEPLLVTRAERSRSLSTADVIATAVALSSGRAEEAGVTISAHGEDVSFWGRATPAVQVLDNLIDNAIRWAGRDGESPSVVISTDAEGRRILVSDNGHGIDPAISEDLFEPFATMRVDGRGLGLYIARELASSLGGDLVVDDGGRDAAATDAGAGACFAFILPPESNR